MTPSTGFHGPSLDTPRSVCHLREVHQVMTAGPLRAVVRQAMAPDALDGVVKSDREKYGIYRSRYVHTHLPNLLPGWHVRTVPGPASQRSRLAGAARRRHGCWCTRSCARAAGARLAPGLSGWGRGRDRGWGRGCRLKTYHKPRTAAALSGSVQCTVQVWSCHCVPLQTHLQPFAARGSTWPE